MKRFSFITLLLMALISCQSDPFAIQSPLIRELALSSDSCILQENHLWVSNQYQTANPSLKGIGGIKGAYAPPLNLSSADVTVLFGGEELSVSSYQWYPGEIHLWAKGKDVEVRSVMMPFVSGKRVAQVIEIHNTSGSELRLPISVNAAPQLKFDVADWGWVPPSAGKQCKFTTALDNGLRYESEDGFVDVELHGMDATIDNESLAVALSLPPNGKQRITLLLSYGKNSEKVQTVKPSSDPITAMEESRNNWHARIEAIYGKLGNLSTSNKSLDMFYKRSLLSILTCEWEGNDYLFSPYYSESGVDGGAMCSYMWGLAYVTKIFPLYNPKAWKRQIEQAIKTDAKNHYAFTPFTGEGVGPVYSYNQYSAVRYIYDYVMTTGDADFLKEKIEGRRVIDYCVEQACYRDDQEKPVELINYGTNENLLELKKTMTFQFYVPSPNAERCWSYRAVAEMSRLIGEPDRGFDGRADRLAEVINKELWSEEEGWYLSKDTLGAKHFCPSIQIFDMLRCGIMNKEQETKVLAHLNEEEFLSDYGVHSLSKLEPGYDNNDADWGGPGVYAGDGVELVDDLYLSGHPEKADDLLGRLLWWGDRLPYYPQAICAASVDYRRNGRANVLSGFSPAQTILFGLLDLRFHPDGQISIQPNHSALFTTFQLDNITLKEKRYTIRIDQGYIHINGKKHERKLPQERIFL